MSAEDVQTYYDLLEVSETATPEEIKSAYRRLCHDYHPDKFAGQPAWVREEAGERFRQLKEAYDVLINPAQRARYDELRRCRARQWGPVPQPSTPPPPKPPNSGAPPPQTPTSSPPRRPGGQPQNTRHTVAGFTAVGAILAVFAGIALSTRPQVLSQPESSTFADRAGEEQAKLPGGIAQFTGRWRGIVRQSSPSMTYEVAMELQEGVIGARVGSIAYPSLRCGGDLKLIDYYTDTVMLLETITFGDSCVNGGTIHISRQASGQVRWDWFHEDGRHSASCLDLRRAGDGSSS